MSTAVSPIHGSIRIDGNPSDGAEAFLLTAAGKVIAIARTNGSGSYALEPPPGWTGGWVLAKLYRPIVGVRAQRVDAAGGQVDFAVASREAVSLSGTVVLPEDVKADWLDVHITPRAGSHLPAEAKDAVLAVDTGTGIRSTYYSERTTTASFRLRLLPGRYNLGVDRWVDDDGVRAHQVPSLETATLTRSDGGSAEKSASGFVLDIERDLQVTVGLRVVPRS